MPAVEGQSTNSFANQEVNTLSYVLIELFNKRINGSRCVGHVIFSIGTNKRQKPRLTIHHCTNLFQFTVRLLIGGEGTVNISRHCGLLLFLQVFNAWRTGFTLGRRRGQRIHQLSVLWHRKNVFVYFHVFCLPVWRSCGDSTGSTCIWSDFQSVMNTWDSLLLPRGIERDKKLIVGSRKKKNIW